MAINTISILHQILQEHIKIKLGLFQLTMVFLYNLGIKSKIKLHKRFMP